jgi:hypothetical protein
LKNGDISNELPRRIIVVSDIFLTVELKIEKKLKFFPVPKVDKKIRREILSYLYLYTTKNGVTLELASFDIDQEELGKTVDVLDSMGTNPFRYFSAYDSVNHLVAELPYRPEVIGVLDTPNRLLRYGHWGLDIQSL